MRTGLSTIQQTLTPEAAAVLNRSIAEAARRNHGQTTPLHVAATLLASPTGFLRQACIRSHPNSSHPLQCRALELCFSVALDRLPSATNSNTSSSGSSGLVREPPISNALMAALKRAQAHQRRGCPEQQQQPLLAVKVELEQLVVSILDDPSVSRVMREASFSSPAVKATIEQSMTTTSNSSSSAAASIPPTAAASSPSLSLSTSTAGRLGGLGLRSIPITLIPGNRNMYLNPLLQQQQQKLVEGSGGGAAPAPAPLREEEVKKVLEILQRTKKRNPVLVGDSEPETLLKEVLQRFTRKEGVDGVLRNVQVISLEKEFASDRSQIPQKLKELGNSLETRLRPYDRDSGGGGLILNLGDLKWLVEAPNGSVQSSGSISIQRQQLVSEVGRAAVAEMGKLVVRFVEGGSDRRLWLIGTASCATYLRCQVYHPSMENDWDLQAMPIAPRAPLPSLFPRTAGTGGILSSSVESLAPARGFPPMTATSSPLRRPSDKIDPSRKPMCQSCTESYDRELAKLVEMEFQRSKSSSDSKPEERQPSLLPQWLQAAKLGNGTTNHDQTREQDQKWKQSTGDLLKKWTETCSRLHSNPNLLLHQPFEPKPLLLPATKTCSPLRLSDHGGLRPLPGVPERVISPRGSPVRTDLALGSRPMVSDEQNHRDRIAYSGGCAQDFFSKQHPREETGIGNFDPDPFKRLFKGLSETISWQPEAASAVAVTVTQCKFGNGKRRATGAKSDTWLIFVGPDKVGKKKMATALSELVFGPGEGPVTVSLSGSSRPDSEDMESSARFRGKLALDRIAEAVRRNPFAVFVLEDVDQADAVVQGSIRRAMEKGRLPYSHGREVALGSAIFIMTSNSLPENLRISATDSLIRSEEKLEAAANGKWQLELSIEEKAAKRRPEWLCEGEDERQTKPRKEPRGEISLDLNLAAGVLGEETATGDSSRNSSDVTVEHEHGHDYGRLAVKGRSTSMPKELMDAVDDTIVFKPVDFGPLRRKVSDALSRKFSSVVGGGRTVQVEEEALDRIVGGVWFGGGAAAGLEEWMERVLVPCFRQLKSVKTADDGSLVVKLVTVRDGFPPTRIDGLPIHVTITGCGGCGQ